MTARELGCGLPSRTGWTRGLYPCSELLPLTVGDAHDLDVKDEVGVRGDHSTCAPRAVTELGGDAQDELVTLANVLKPLFPPLDDLVPPKSEFEGLAAVPARVELRLAASSEPSKIFKPGGSDAGNRGKGGGVEGETAAPAPSSRP